ncbi:single-stranded DNA-binding protein [Nocardia cyriacigeorgica]|uniref:Single-stranded DNA-binding protein n=1 Tax=Nocardia cyriacigeorgica TaxID=135487 RepID=A0A4U8VS13_9NOCA|nr:single-stranded DNA-binding protein [Nocardia cyriacigeorgica]VFA96346.1 Helix-destabilizing protein [Nocardia cyriacigeorgica]
MSADTTLTIIGNLTAAPELRFTPHGVAVANFTVASTPRRFDRQAGEWTDGDALFMPCAVWRDAAENLAESNLPRGARVIVTGRLKQRTYETKDGQKRTVVELHVDEVGPSTRWATAKVTRVNRKADTAARPAVADDPWGNAGSSEPVFAGAAAGGFADEAPF